MCVKKEEQNHVRPIAQGRTQRATATICRQTHGLVHIVPAPRRGNQPDGIYSKGGVKHQRGARSKPVGTVLGRFATPPPGTRGGVQECAGWVLLGDLPLARIDTGTDTNTG